MKKVFWWMAVFPVQLIISVLFIPMHLMHWFWDEMSYWFGYIEGVCWDLHKQGYHYNGSWSRGIYPAGRSKK